MVSEQTLNSSLASCRTKALPLTIPIVLANTPDAENQSHNLQSCNTNACLHGACYRTVTETMNRDRRGIALRFSHQSSFPLVSAFFFLTILFSHLSLLALLVSTFFTLFCITDLFSVETIAKSRCIAPETEEQKSRKREKTCLAS